MDTIQQRIIEIALQIPEYVGYQAKERRRDADRLVRRQLARKYDEQRARLARLQQKAGMEFVDDIEHLDQKLLRLIAQFNTAPRGYAGWFDAAQIGDADLDQLTKFDADLANGVNRLKTALDQLADAFKAKTGVDDAIDACAETLDALNSEFEQRDDFVAQGKKPTVELPSSPRVSPLDALEAKKAPAQEVVALANLKVNDAVSFGGSDYIVAGKMTYSVATGSFWAFLLQDREKHWLRVGPGGELAICQEVIFSVPSPLPESLTYDKQTFTRADEDTAKVSVEGAGGVKRGTVDYARYTTDIGSRLWVENFGTETRVMIGETVDASELKLYRR